MTFATIPQHASSLQPEMHSMATGSWAHAFGLLQPPPPPSVEHLKFGAVCLDAV